MFKALLSVTFIVLFASRLNGLPVPADESAEQSTSTSVSFSVRTGELDLEWSIGS